TRQITDTQPTGGGVLLFRSRAGRHGGGTFAVIGAMMRCPECHTPYEANAAACATCGLLLLTLAPHRRAEDFATKKRRAADQMAPCKFCGSDIPLDAIR